MSGAGRALEWAAIGGAMGMVFGAVIGTAVGSIMQTERWVPATRFRPRD